MAEEYIKISLIEAGGERILITLPRRKEGCCCRKRDRAYPMLYFNPAADPLYDEVLSC